MKIRIVLNTTGLNKSDFHFDSVCIVDLMFVDELEFIDYSSFFVN